MTRRTTRTRGTASSPTRAHRAISTPTKKKRPRHEQGDAQRDENPVEERGKAVEDQPHRLAGVGEGVLGFAVPEHVALGEIAEISVGRGPQVRDFEPVAKDVVGVELQQGVPVEEQRRDPGDEHRVVGHGPGRARFEGKPEEHGDRGDHEFHGDAGPPDGHPLPLAPEGGRGRGVDVGDGHEDDEHHPHSRAPPRPSA